MNKRLRIIHTTEYHHSEPVRCGVQRVLMQTREGRDLRIIEATAEASPWIHHSQRKRGFQLD